MAGCRRHPVWTGGDRKIAPKFWETGDRPLGFDNANDEHTVIDIPFPEETGPYVEVWIGETERHQFATRAAAMAFALKSAQERSRQGGSVSINIEGADHVWRLFDPNMKPRT